MATHMQFTVVLMCVCGVIQLVTKKNSLVKLAKDEDAFTLTFSDLQVMSSVPVYDVNFVMFHGQIVRDDNGWFHQEVFTIWLFC